MPTEFPLNAHGMPSECSLSVLRVPSECSLSALWVFSECSLKIWARLVKIECSWKTWHPKTERRAFLELLLSSIFIQLYLDIYPQIRDITLTISWRNAFYLNKTLKYFSRILLINIHGTLTVKLQKLYEKLKKNYIVDQVFTWFLIWFK